MKKKTDYISKLISIFLCAALIFGTASVYAPHASAESLSSLKDNYSELEDKVSESEKKVAELESQKDKQEEIVAELNTQIDKLNSEIDNIISQKNIISDDISATEQKISDLNDEISDLDAQIAQKDKDIENTVNLFCERMRASYMSGGASMLEILTSSSDVAGFLNRLELFKRVTESDQSLVDQLNEEIASIEKMQKELETKKSNLQQEKTTLVNKRTDLQTSEDEMTAKQNEILTKSKAINDKIDAINGQKQAIKVSISQYTKEMQEIDDEITAYLKEQASSSSGSSGSSGSSSSSLSSGGWLWPVPYSSSYISSTYGYRGDPISGSYKFHGGLDISMGGAYGKNIVATKSGTVLKTVYGSTGYGIYIMIDHGGGYVSLYGHCSSLTVSTGQKVKQGQVIAHIGSTGYSTGAHCHFEIRRNGERVNPLNYVSR